MSWGQGHVCILYRQGGMLMYARTSPVPGNRAPKTKHRRGAGRCLPRCMADGGGCQYGAWNREGRKADPSAGVQCNAGTAPPPAAVGFMTASAYEKQLQQQPLKPPRPHKKAGKAPAKPLQQTNSLWSMVQKQKPGQQ